MKHVFNDDFLDFLKAMENAGVQYLLVGGYAVVLHGYHRSTGDLDIWADPTEENHKRLLHAFAAFGIPQSAIPLEQFINATEVDVFTFGRPPVAIDVMTAVKGLDFQQAYLVHETVKIEDINIHFLDKGSLMIAKKASARHKDLDDIEHLNEEI